MVMMEGCWPMVRRVRLIGKALLSVLMVCCLTDIACSESKPASSAYDVTQRRLDLIPAGTVIGKEAPEGWTHLLIKSHPHPGGGDTKELSSTADRLSRFLFTAILANVKAEKNDRDTRYKLAQVAVGVGTSINNMDTIITPQTQRGLGANLGLLARVVLHTSQEKLGDIVVVARSDTMMVFDVPSLMVREERHKPVVLRYAVLVDVKTGRLDTLLWVLDREEYDRHDGPAGDIQWLSANKIEDCVLHVDSSEFSLGQPTEKAFALIHAPRGKKEIAVGDDLKPLVTRRRFSPATAAELEKKLHDALKQAAES
jgi:hypothetical protein